VLARGGTRHVGSGAAFVLLGVHECVIDEGVERADAEQLRASGGDEWEGTVGGRDKFKRAGADMQTLFALKHCHMAAVRKRTFRN